MILIWIGIEFVGHAQSSNFPQGCVEGWGVGGRANAGYHTLQLPTALQYSLQICRHLLNIPVVQTTYYYYPILMSIENQLDFTAFFLCIYLTVFTKDYKTVYINC